MDGAGTGTGVALAMALAVAICLGLTLSQSGLMGPQVPLYPLPALCSTMIKSQLGEMVFSIFL